MQFLQLLSGVVAYTIILLEVYSGAIRGPLWWVIPGGLVLALLLGLQMLMQPQGTNGVPAQVSQNPVFGLFRWIFILLIAFGASYIANYFGREMIPCELLKAEGWSAPADVVARCASSPTQ